MKESTACVHGHEYYDERYGLFKVPIHLTAVYEQFDLRTGGERLSDRGLPQEYSRHENVTVRALEKALSKLERGLESLAFNSGMAAISTLATSMLSSGDEVVVGWECYYQVRELMERLNKMGVKTRLALPNAEDFIANVNSRTKLVIVETITNPLLKVLDVREVIKACGEGGGSALCAVDNTFATPIIYNPINDGAKVVVHSLTKYLAGHNDVLGGAVVLGDLGYFKDLWDWRRLLGNIISPLDAYLVLRGLSTLECRLVKSSNSALEIAKYLRDHPKVEEVFYPGLSDSPYHGIANKLFKRRLYGGVLSFRIRGGSAEVVEFIKNLKVIKPSASLGGVESLIYYPRRYLLSIPPELRRKIGLSESTLRLSVGLEDPDDLIGDLGNALKKVS